MDHQRPTACRARATVTMALQLCLYHRCVCILKHCWKQPPKIHPKFSYFLIISPKEKDRHGITLLWRIVWSKCVCFLKCASYSSPWGSAEVETAVLFWSRRGELDKVPEGISKSMSSFSNKASSHWIGKTFYSHADSYSRHSVWSYFSLTVPISLKIGISAVISSTVRNTAQRWVWHWSSAHPQPMPAPASNKTLMPLAQKIVFSTATAV